MKHNRNLRAIVSGSTTGICSHIGIKSGRCDASIGGCRNQPTLSLGDLRASFLWSGSVSNGQITEGLCIAQDPPHELTCWRG